MTALGGKPNTDVGGKPLSVPRMLSNASFLLTTNLGKGDTPLDKSFKTWQQAREGGSHAAKILRGAKT